MKLTRHHPVRASLSDKSQSTLNTTLNITGTVAIDLKGSRLDKSEVPEGMRFFLCAWLKSDFEYVEIAPDGSVHIELPLTPSSVDMLKLAVHAFAIDPETKLSKAFQLCCACECMHKLSTGAPISGKFVDPFSDPPDIQYELAALPFDSSTLAKSAVRDMHRSQPCTL
jgi:hypothetical protein